ncbi:MAG TPA: ABC transporter permease [Candidatus Acidoferrum sp.]|nr:ABC transporter permease [Candidatus Acidoferrum sp.]
MRLWSRIRSWLRAVMRRARTENEMHAELCFHVEAFAEDLVRGGVPREEALRRASIEFGGVERAKEECREARGVSFIDSMVQDLRFGLRMLAKAPGFTTVVVLSLALGIGANTAIFTLLDAVLFKMLPVKNPQELALLQWAVPDERVRPSLWYDGSSWNEGGEHVGFSFSYPAFEQLRARNDVLSDLFAFADLGNDMNVVADGEPSLAHAQMATGRIFSTLGVQPVAGRLFADSDDRPGAPAVCVISGGYWKQRFGAQPDIAGKTVIIAGVLFNIIGVTPQSFSGLTAGSNVDVWVPLSTQPLVEPNLDPRVSMFTAADHWWVQIMGRLRAGVSRAQATAGLDVIFKPTAAEGIHSRPGQRLVIPSIELGRPGQGFGELRNRFSRALFVLMGLVGLVLLIACANVANLLLARAASRQREIGMRLSLGASRGRLIRQLLTESILLSFVGGAVGCLFAGWGTSLLISLITSTGNNISLRTGPDWGVAGFTTGVCLITGILFGLAPAWRAARTDLAPGLKQGAQAAQSAGLRLGLGKALVVSQVALSLVLLFGAGLFVRTLVKLENVDTGFDTRNVLLFCLNPTKSGYKEAALNDFFFRVRQRVALLPGVTSATASFHEPLNDGRRSNGLKVPGLSLPPEQMDVAIMPAGPNFLATMKIPLLGGRDFDERDNDRAPKVAVVNETFVKLYFSDRDPIGQHIGLDSGPPSIEIVGIARDARYGSLREAAPATVYRPFSQDSAIPFMCYELRTAVSPLLLVPAVRAAVAAIDRNVPLSGIETESQQIDDALLQERLFAKLSGFFGLVALLLACVGLYGILSYAVARRTSEIGIRMALGAQRANVLSLVMRDTLLLVIAGVAIGIPAALAATCYASSLISDLLYGVKANDAPTIGLSTLVLIAVGLFAGFLPARRATKVDPMVALRHE